VVKVAKPKQDLRFDVPVMAFTRLKRCERRGQHVALEAHRTLIFDGNGSGEADARDAVIASKTDNGRARILVHTYAVPTGKSGTEPGLVTNKGEMLCEISRLALASPSF